MAHSGELAQHQALRELVAGLNHATERRERARRGTRAFRDAETVQRRYREILLDDELFERYLSGDPALEAALPPVPDGDRRPAAQPRATSPLGRARPPVRAAP